MSYTTHAPYPPPPPPPRGRTGLKIFAVLLTLFLLVSLFANFIMFLMVVVFSAAAGGSNSEGPASHVESETLRAGAGLGAGSKIAVVPVSGTVDEKMTEEMLAFCEYLKTDPAIRGVGLEVDSPGGGITASDEIHHLFADLKGSGRRLVVSMRSLAASGGYYISMPADKIYAQPTTLTGSIGVIWPAFEVTGMMEKVGVTPEVIKSDLANDYKDAGSPLKKFTDKDRQYIRALVNNAHAKFSAVVDAGRKGKLKEPVADIAVGKIWPADEALKLGLIDEIAYLDEVCTQTAADLGLANPTVVRLRRKTGLLEALTVKSISPKVEVKIDRNALEGLMGGSDAPRMEYRAPVLQ
jgi:protease-4